MIAFACPSCDAKGSAPEAYIGKSARCKHCGYVFNIPEPGRATVETYAIDDPVPAAAIPPTIVQDQESVFVPSRGDEPPHSQGSYRKSQTTSPDRRKPQRESSPALKMWLIRGGLFGVGLLGAVILFAPRGYLIGGCTLLIIGSIMVLAGYIAGAVGAFSEDFLYGFLYVVIPLYTAYYILTRWDDLWVWFACASGGVGLVLLGTELVRASGFVV